MSASRPLVLASANSGKLREFRQLLEPFGFSLSTLAEHGVETPDETGLSFIENAILKARHAARATGLPALADDSGLEVAALNGAPGLYSSRYAEHAGRGEGSEANWQYLLEQLAGRPEAQRQANFRCVIVLLRHAEDPAPLLAEGVWHGHILETPEGEGGFGYDPVFCNHDTGESAAMLDPATKNRLSHRGRAMAKLLNLLEAQHKLEQRLQG